MFSELLLIAVCRYTPPPAVIDALGHFEGWEKAASRTRRVERLLSFVRQKRQGSPRSKVLLFAGFPGIAAPVAGYLREELSAEEIAEFRAEMDPESKEASVARFRDSRACWLLVSDETGGEGRNFQFADEILHFDTPWSAARIEQRIGRLDRLGREAARDVVSNVIFSETSAESGLVQCYDRGSVSTLSRSAVSSSLCAMSKDAPWDGDRSGPGRA